jgi:hypothetical protein
VLGAEPLITAAFLAPDWSREGVTQAGRAGASPVVAKDRMGRESQWSAISPSPVHRSPQRRRQPDSIEIDPGPG